MRSLSLPAGLLLLGAAFASPRWASAEPPVANKAAADALYDQAKALISEKKYDQALEKLLASQRLDPALGTLLNTAFCYERLGKTASAWATYNDVTGIAKATDDKQGRGERAAQAAKALEPRLSKVVVTVPSDNRVPKMEIRRDGDLVDPATWDTPIPIDPGKHAFEAWAPGRARWQGSIDIPEGPGTTAVSVPLLAMGPPEHAEARPEASAWGTQRIVGVGVAGGGVIAVVTGAIFGVLAITKKNAEAAHCQPANPHECDATGVALRAQGLTMANGSNVSFALAGAALATGAGLYLTAPRAAGRDTAFEVSVAPAVAAESGGVWITGRW